MEKAVVEGKQGKSGKWLRRSNEERARDFLEAVERSRVTCRFSQDNRVALRGGERWRGVWAEGWAWSLQEENGWHCVGSSTVRA